MIGKQLGYLRITSKLGQGGMGEVYRAEDTRLNREVAVKVLPAEMADAPERLERFQREAKAVAALNHPNIVTIHSVEQATLVESQGPGDGAAGDTVHFIVMELVEGRTLDHLITERGLPLDEIFDVAVPLTDALTAAYAQGITHRDLKPANVMVTGEGRVKVLDFGLAKLQQETAAADATQLPTEVLTQEGLALGTLPYMSPEQAEGKPVDPRSDIFSLGVMLYEMASGRRPFAGDTSASLVSSILRDAPPAVTELNPELPRHLGRVIGRCLEKQPADRYQSARDVYNELRGLRKEVESGATPISSAALPAAPAPKTARPYRLWAVAGLAVLALALVALWLLPGGDEAGPAGIAEPPSAAAEARQMIAVLPFENLGPPEDEYFAAGMAEEITSRLSTVRGLGVISRKSAMTYAGSTKTTQEIGRELAVDYLIQGSIRWARSGEGAGRVRITPQLIRVSDDTQVWSAAYDRVVNDIFDVQSEIAAQVIDELGITLRATERGALAAAPTDNVEAFGAYVRGIDYTVQWDAESLRQAVSMFERAVELDPGFAAAWAYLARAHAQIVHFGFDRSESRISAAREAAQRALELAPESPQSYQALGMYHYHAHKEYGLAEEAFAAADRLRPDLPEVLEGWGLVQRRRGRWEESTRNMEKAVRLSPRDENLLINLGSNYVYLRRYPEALQVLDRCLEVRPDAYWCQNYRWEAFVGLDGTTSRARKVADALPRSGMDIAVFLRYLQAVLERDYERAVAELEPADEIIEAGAVHRPTSLLAALALSLQGDSARAREAFERTRRALERDLEQRPEHFEVRTSLGIAYAGLGLREQAVREGLRALEAYPLSRDATWGPDLVKDMAQIYTMVGQPEDALGQLDRLLTIPSNFSVGLLRLEPWWDALRDHPGYRELIEKHG